MLRGEFLLLVDGKLGHLPLLQPHKQPGIAILIHQHQQLFQRGSLRAFGGKALKIHGHFPAADHADVVDLRRMEGKGVEPGGAAFQDLQPLQDRVALHGAAAYGSLGGSIGKHRHFCSRPSGRRAGACQNGAQHRFLSGVQPPEHRL